MNWLCRLFGHKYVFTKKVRDGYYGRYEPAKTDYCVRCGHKPTNTKSIKKNTIQFKEDMTNLSERNGYE